MPRRSLLHPSRLFCSSQSFFPASISCTCLVPRGTLTCLSRPFAEHHAELVVWGAVEASIPHHDGVQSLESCPQLSLRSLLLESGAQVPRLQTLRNTPRSLMQPKPRPGLRRRSVRCRAERMKRCSLLHPLGSATQADSRAVATTRRVGRRLHL